MSLQRQPEPFQQREQQRDGTRHVAGACRPSANRAFVNVQQARAGGLSEVLTAEKRPEVVGTHSAPQRRQEGRIVAQEAVDGVAATVDFRAGFLSQPSRADAVSQSRQDIEFCAHQFGAERERVTIFFRVERDQLRFGHVADDAVGGVRAGHLDLQRAWAPFRMTAPYQDILSAVNGEIA